MFRAATSSVHLGELLLKVRLPLLRLLQVGPHLIPRDRRVGTGFLRVINLLLQDFQLLFGTSAVLGHLLELGAGVGELLLHLGIGRLGPLYACFRVRDLG